MGLPTKKHSLEKTPNQRIKVVEEKFPYGDDDEVLDWLEKGDVTYDDDFSCAVHEVSGIDNVSSKKEGFMVRRGFSLETRNVRGGILLAVTTATETRDIGANLRASGWKELCTFLSNDGQRELTLWGAYPIR